MQEGELIRFLKTALEEADKRGIQDEFQLRFKAEWLRTELENLESQEDIWSTVIRPMVRNDISQKRIMRNDTYVALVAGIEGMAKKGDIEKIEPFLRLALGPFIEIDK